MDISNITGVVLAGGTNSRYGGKIKANEIVGGERIILSILKTIRPIFGEIIIVTNTPEAFADISGCKITGDHFLKRGPLGGIHAAMKASSGDAIFVFAGDMPFLNKRLILSQASDYISNPADVLIPQFNGNIEPLHSIYRTDLVEKLEEFLSDGSDNMIRSFFNKLSVRYFNVPESEAYTRSFTNINTLIDLQRTNIEVLTPSPLVEGWDGGLSLSGRDGGLPFSGHVTGVTSQAQASDLSLILKKYTPKKEHLLSILHDIQKNSPEHYISADDIKIVAEYLNITLSSVYGVVTYYSMFSLKPRGKYIIRTCSSPVCEMEGSGGILKVLETKLSIARGRTTTDGLFTLETCECLGHCDESPCMIINDEFYGNIDGCKIDEIIDGLKQAAE